MFFEYARRYVLRGLAGDDAVVVARGTGTQRLEMVESCDGHPGKRPVTAVALVGCLQMRLWLPRRPDAACL